jgi:hypothetical protein
VEVIRVEREVGCNIGVIVGINDGNRHALSLIGDPVEAISSPKLRWQSARGNLGLRRIENNNVGVSMARSSVRRLGHQRERGDKQGRQADPQNTKFLHILLNLFRTASVVYF